MLKWNKVHFTFKWQWKTVCFTFSKYIIRGLKVDLVYWMFIKYFYKENV